jgi:hypothetical protein
MLSNSYSNPDKFVKYVYFSKANMQRSFQNKNNLLFQFKII